VKQRYIAYLVISWGYIDTIALLGNTPLATFKQNFIRDVAERYLGLKGREMKTLALNNFRDRQSYQSN